MTRTSHSNKYFKGILQPLKFQHNDNFTCLTFRSGLIDLIIRASNHIFCIVRSFVKFHKISHNFEILKQSNKHTVPLSSSPSLSSIISSAHTRFSVYKDRMSMR